jgi:ABC-type tungstate transport system substrate-binding protein
MKNLLLCFPVVIAFALGCAQSGSVSKIQNSSATTGDASFTFAPNLSADLRSALGDSAVAAISDAVKRFYSSTPSGAATEAASKAVDAAASAYREKNGTELPAATKERLRGELEAELKKKAIRE